MALVASLVVVGVPQDAQAAAALPQNFRETGHFTGLRAPTSTAFAPDGKAFITEKRGIVKVFDGLSDTSSQTVIDLRTEVFNWNDRGLTSVAVDPAYPAEPYIYIVYARDAEPGGDAPRWGGTSDNDDCPDSTNGCLGTGRVARVQVDTSIGVAVGPAQPLVTDWCMQFGSHAIDDVRFGPDGYLYVSGGDGASYSFPDWGQQGNACGDPPTPGASLSPPDAMGGALRSQSARRPASETASLSGSVVRIDPVTGAAAPGNPFASAQDDVRQRIIAYGMRNPFRFAFRPGTDELWIGDVGNNNYEEVNFVADVNDDSAENFGWPCYEGPRAWGAFDNVNVTLCESLYAEGSAASPAFAYAHDSLVVPGENCSTGSSSISGLEFYSGTSYPARFRGGLFFADYARACLWFAPAGADGRPDFSQVETFATAAGTFRPVHITTGPGDDLYLTDVSGGLVRRISYEGGNQTPVASVSASVTSGSAPLDVDFSAADSFDPDGSALTYTWDLDGDGAFDDATGATTSWTYSDPAQVLVRVQVTDDDGASDEASVVISAGNDPPQAEITSPLADATWSVGDTVTVTGVGTDQQDGQLSAESMEWEAVLKHCPSNCHEHFLGTWTGDSSITLTAPDHEYPSWIEVTLTVTDLQGLSASTTRRLDPAVTSLGFRTEPAGLSVISGLDSTRTPFDQPVIVGSTNSITAPEFQTLDGRRYQFESWADGGDRSQLLLAAPDPQILTARYTDVGPADGDTTPPSIPGPLLGGYEDGLITVTWPESSDDFGVEEYVVHRSVTSGFNPSGSTGVARTPDLTWSAPPTGEGTFYFKVVAVDAAGNSSAPSEQIEIVVPETTPLDPAEDVLAIATGDNVALTWSHPAPGDTTFAVHRSDTPDFSPTFDTLVLQTDSAVATDSDVPVGTWYYRVVAQHPDGRTAAASNSVSAVVHLAGAYPVAADSFDRSISGGWGDAPSGGTWAVSHPADFDVDSSAGRVNNPSPGTDRNAWLDQTPVLDTDLTAVITAAPDLLTGRGQTVKLVARRQAAYHEYRAVLNLRGDGRVDLGLRALTPGQTESGPTITLPQTHTPGDSWHLRLQVTGVEPTTLRAKAWPVGDPEPPSWNLTSADSTSTLQVAGAVGFGNYVSGSASGTPATTSVDYFAAAAVGGALDTDAPTVPRDVELVSTGPDAVTIRWSASSDDTAVAGYRVRLGGDVVVDTQQTSAAVTDLKPSTSYQIDVVAYDAAGNQSDPSTALTVTTSPVAPDSVLVAAGSVWAFRDDDVDLGTSWRDPGYVDADWPRGVAQLGYGDGDEVTVVSPNLVTYYLRSQFSVADAGSVSSLSMRVLLDDGAVVFLNGEEVWRDNMPAGEPVFGTRAVTFVGGAAEDAWREFDLPVSALVSGVNTVAVSLHNESSWSSDISFDMSLTAVGGGGEPPPDTVAPSVPQNVRVVSVGTDSAELAWDASDDAGSGVAGYRVLVDADPPVEVAGTQVSLVGLSAGSSYEVSVVAVDGAGNVSDASVPVTVTTQEAPDTVAPSVPQNVRVVSVGTDSAELAWDASDDAGSGVAGYRVLVDADPPVEVAGTQVSLVGLSAGSSYEVSVVAVDGAGNVSDASVPVTVTTQEAPDTVAPSVPQNVRVVSVGTDSAELAWDASDDAGSGVAGYRVLVDADPPVEVAGTQVSLVGLSAGSSYEVSVVAVDGAGNVSDASVPVTVTTQDDQAGPPQVVTVSAVHDAFVSEGSPTQNTGSSWVLRPKGGSSARVAYMSFEVPEPEPGRLLVGAELSLTMSSNVWAGGADPYDVRLVPDTSWDESTLTWQNRPAVSGTLLGEIPGGTEPSETYTVTLSAADIVALVGGQVSMAVLGPSSDSLEFWSSEHPGQDLTLTLTYQ